MSGILVSPSAADKVKAWANTSGTGFYQLHITVTKKYVDLKFQPVETLEDMMGQIGNDPTPAYIFCKHKGKLALASYCPEENHVRVRMVYAATLPAVKHTFNPDVNFDVQDRLDLEPFFGEFLGTTTHALK